MNGERTNSPRGIAVMGWIVAVAVTAWLVTAVLWATAFLIAHWP